RVERQQPGGAAIPDRPVEKTGDEDLVVVQHQQVERLVPVVGHVTQHALVAEARVQVAVREVAQDPDVGVAAAAWRHAARDQDSTVTVYGDAFSDVGITGYVDTGGNPTAAEGAV